ncbi:hypothetical protein [Modestobacter marinus]|uniref:hypothetical protein n=1 Tax=Modestobacter marinus TaxID=477641 RepID=UPI00201A5582|nr:hypothetical protein [Modestobacter marinus]
MTSGTGVAATPAWTGQVLVRRAAVGVTGGLVGGVVFGLMMQAWGMIPMVAQLVESSSTTVGWVVHLLISAFFGAVLAVALGHVVRGLLPGTLLGVGYGAVLWVIGPLVLMPARLGMPLFTIDDMTLQSLVGHLVFGLLLGVLSAALLRSRAARP